ncbi:unnamed protein product [Urochloa decumbens]|uniref:DUF295 domain-containing protein n=1 Tax=Urochloa decumbens TaxID=240449 RepID=A0ABC9BZR9_9POAL
MEMAAALPSSWEELPPDILGLVLRHLPSLADRVHLRAVCRPWRAGAHPQRHKPLPPPLPWLALRDGTLVDLRGAPVRCVPILRDGVFRYLAVDNLAFLVHDDGSCSLMNPLSGQTLPLPDLAPAVRRAIDSVPAYGQSFIRNGHVKVILPSPPDWTWTSDPLMAVLVLDGYCVVVSGFKQHEAVSISICSERAEGPERNHDIAFLHGKLYILTFKEGLRVFKHDASHLGNPKSSPGFHQCIAEDPKQQEIYGYRNNPSYYVPRYLAESNGRLLMVRRWMSVPRNARLRDHGKTVGFEVFEADLTSTPGKWTKLESLGGQTLFLSSQCTKSLLASQCAGGVQEDCIYFMHRAFDNPSCEYVGPCVDPLADSGVYSMRDGKITPLLPEPVMAEMQRKRQFLTWFFPADA